MTDEQFTPDELKVIEALQAPPRPKIDPARAQAIHQQLLHELRTSPRPSGRRPLSRRWIIQAAVGLAAAAAIIVLVITQGVNQPAAALGTLIPPPPTNQVAVLPSATATTGTAALIPTATPTVQFEPSSTPTINPTVTIMTLTPVPTQPEAVVTASAAALVIIEGQVSDIEGDQITINGFTIQVAPDHPILKMIEVGDNLHVEGDLGAQGLIVPTVISNLPETSVNTTNTPVTVGLDGPVDAINGNTVTVNGIAVQFAPDDPVLKTLQVGNFVSVQGNFSGSGTAIILVVVNVTVFNNITLINNNCWFDPGPDPAMGMEDPAMAVPPAMGMEDPGMGHWHCDGMGAPPPPPAGMGAPAMGAPPPPPPAMGMEDPGMGMGG